jgi:hypothetical protein
MPEPKPSEDFTVLRSDIKLRESMAELVCENPSDKVAIDFILKMPKMSGQQRVWLKSILQREGKRFIFAERGKQG